MSHRTVELLNRWVSDTVRAVPAEETEKEARRLAVEFTAFAVDAGLNVEMLEDDIGEDLVSFMIDALQAAADAESRDLAGDDV